MYIFFVFHTLSRCSVPILLLIDWFFTRGYRLYHNFLKVLSFLSTLRILVICLYLTLLSVMFCYRTCICFHIYTIEKKVLFFLIFNSLSVIPLYTFALSANYHMNSLTVITFFPSLFFIYTNSQPFALFILIHNPLPYLY